MKIHSTLALSLLGLTLGTAAIAAPVWSTTPVALFGVEVDTFPAATNGTATFLSFATPPDGKPLCGSRGQAELTGSVDNVKAMTSLATAAFLAGRTVRVQWDGTCDNNYAKVAMLLVQ